MPDKSLKILVLTEEFPPYPGGIATTALQFSRELDVHDVDVHVFTRHRQPVFTDTAAHDASLPFPVTRHTPARFRVLSLISRFWMLLGVLRRFRPDAMVCNNTQNTLLAWLMTRIAPHPFFVILYGTEIEQVGFLARRAYRSARGCVAISRYTADVFKANTGLKAEVINLGIDTQQYRPSLRATRRGRHLLRKLGVTGKPVLLTVGRLHPRKGQDIALEAFKNLLKEEPNAHFVIVGFRMKNYMDYYHRLVGYVVEHGLHDRVHFLESIEAADLCALYSAVDIFLLASRRDGREVEGFGLVLLEANAMGTPAVGARSGGIPDAVKEGVTGYLVEEGNAGELAEKVKVMWKDQTRFSALRRSALSYVQEKATWRRAAAQLESYIRRRLKTG